VTDDDDDPTRHRRDDWDTSMEAAESQTEVAQRVRALVLVAHEDNPDGLTDEELSDIVNPDERYGESSPRKRRGELTRDGLIEASPFYRPSRKRKRMIVWRIKRCAHEVSVLIDGQWTCHACHAVMA
jgi:hypothetical protein